MRATKFRKSTQSVIQGLRLRELGIRTSMPQRCMRKRIVAEISKDDLLDGIILGFDRSGRFLVGVCGSKFCLWKVNFGKKRVELVLATGGEIRTTFFRMQLPVPKSTYIMQTMDSRCFVMAQCTGLRWDIADSICLVPFDASEDAVPAIGISFSGGKLLDPPNHFLGLDPNSGRSCLVPFRSPNEIFVVWFDIQEQTNISPQNFDDIKELPPRQILCTAFPANHSPPPHFIDPRCSWLWWEPSKTEFHPIFCSTFKQWKEDSTTKRKNIIETKIMKARVINFEILLRHVVAHDLGFPTPEVAFISHFDGGESCKCSILRRKKRKRKVVPQTDNESQQHCFLEDFEFSLEALCPTGVVLQVSTVLCVRFNEQAHYIGATLKIDTRSGSYLIDRVLSRTTSKVQVSLKQQLNSYRKSNSSWQVNCSDPNLVHAYHFDSLSQPLSEISSAELPIYVKMS